MALDSLETAKDKTPYPHQFFNGRATLYSREKWADNGVKMKIESRSNSGGRGQGRGRGHRTLTGFFDLGREGRTTTRGSKTCMPS